MQRKTTVCILVPDIQQERGGVAALADFVRDALRSSGRYEPTIVSMAVASTDEASIRLLSPASWRRGLRVIQRERRGEVHQHAGCNLAELEFMRYRPRKVLTAILKQFDVIHVVAGAPAWANVTRDCGRAVFLHTASLAASERSQLRRYAFPRWRYWMTLITRRLDRKALLNVRLTFVINRWLEAVVTGLTGNGRVVFNPPGVDTAHFRPHTDAEPVYLLSVGRFADPRKDVATLFRAYAHLRAAMHDAPRLLLAGFNMPDAKAWQLARSLGIDTFVDQHENVSSNELAELYRGAAVYVLSSLEEGLGIPLLEAMSSGVPVVSTRCGGPESVVVDGETGYLTPVGDPAAMAQTIAALLADRETRERMSQRARQVAVEKHSMAGAAQALIAAYDAVLVPQGE
jgi:D-inositol-3-phosphate glycosyltransferase